VFSHVQLLETLQTSLSMDSPGKNTGVGCHALLQGIFPTQGLNLYLFSSPVFAGGFFTTSTTWEAWRRNTLQNKWTSASCVCESLRCVWLFVTPWTVARQAPLFMDSPGKNTRVGCHSFLQGIFLTQGLKPGLLHCRQILYCLSHQGSPIVIIIENKITKLQQRMGELGEW